MIITAGLPRSGSTLLQEILNQNPDIYASQTSGLLPTLIETLSSWNNIVEHKAYKTMGRQTNINDVSQIKKQNVINGMINSYHSEHSEKYKVDKNRNWPEYIEMYKWVTGKNPKILVCVRDIRDILASLESKYRENSSYDISIDKKKLPILMQTINGRCNTWMTDGGVVGNPYLKLKDAIDRGHSDCLHFVSYENLTTIPDKTMNNIYKFLNIPSYKHDFNNIEQVTYENDRVYDMSLHKIKPKLTPSSPKYPLYLPKEVSDIYKNLEFW